MANRGAISRTAKKVIIHVEEAAKYITSAEMDELQRIIMKIENTEKFVGRK